MSFACLPQMPSPPSPLLSIHSGRDEMRISLLGKRFTDESARTSTALVLAQPQGISYSISDATLWDKSNRDNITNVKDHLFMLTPEQANDLDPLLNAPDQPLIRANTLEELANQMGVDARIFRATVKRYNEFCTNGKDEDFGKPAAHLHAIKIPPFYAIRNMVQPHGGCCGVAVNANMEVKAAKGGLVSGLYASGDVVTPSLGSQANILHDLTWAFTGAFIAADSILNYLKSKA